MLKIELWQILESDPENISQDALQLWLRLQPLEFEDVIDLKPGDIKKIEKKIYSYIGQTNTQKQPNGVGRMCWTKSGIYEGEFENGQRTGFGRMINSNGTH